VQFSASSGRTLWWNICQKWRYEKLASFADEKIN